MRRSPGMLLRRRHPTVRVCLSCVGVLASALLLPVCATATEAQRGETASPLRTPCEKEGCSARSERVETIRVLQPGARPRFSPSSDLIVYDARGEDQLYDVHLADGSGKWLRSLTEGRPGIAQRNSGNAIFTPDGEHIVFVSEEEEHLGDRFPGLGDPGLGLFSNLWATDLIGSRFWRLTDIPIKKRLLDRVPSIATVNPEFGPDGRLYWTERYDKGGHHNWGRWRLKSARFVMSEEGPRLEDETVIFQPQKGNYVTSMGFFRKDRLLVAGNLDGQHEYGMDLYILDVVSGEVRQIVDTPSYWEEGACIAPGGRRFAFMSNRESRYRLDFDDGNWATQPTERDYFLIDRDGRAEERLTYFNDPSAPEYLGRRAIVAACSIREDGKLLAGTLGLDEGSERRARLELRLVFIELTSPLR